MREISVFARIERILKKNGPERCSRSLLEGVNTRPSRILCLGKAAPALAVAAHEAFPGTPGLVYGSAEASVPQGFEALWGDHPLPTNRNLENTGAVREWLKTSCGPLLVCLSGGSSALLTEPADGWTIETVRDITEKLLASGASIREVNTVRRRLSKVKAGGLLAGGGCSSVVTAVWSDVGRGDAKLTGSGPTIFWVGRRSAEEILETYSLKTPVPLPSGSPPKPSAATPWFLLFDGLELRRSIASEFRESGYTVREVAVPEGISAARLSEKIVNFADRVRRPSLLVGVGESLVPGGELTSFGGRCTHLVAEVAAGMHSSQMENWVFTAVATDGVDGSAGGGAYTSSECIPPLENIRKAIHNYETGHLWKEAGTLLPRKPTCNNLRDLWVFLAGRTDI